MQLDLAEAEARRAIEELAEAAGSRIPSFAHVSSGVCRKVRARSSCANELALISA